eukprot:7592319-Lingulodinium_polyedra.AAC.1
MIQGLALLCVKDRRLPLSRAVFAGDASDLGYSLSVTMGGKGEVDEAVKHRERWRFAPAEPEPHEGTHVHGYVADAPLLIN